MRELFTVIFFPLVLSLGDTQLITGLAMLLSGWVRLRDDLSVYHFNIIADPALMASGTQLLALSAISYCENAASEESREDLEMTPYTYSPSRFLRVSGMWSTCVMLLVVVVMQSHRACSSLGWTIYNGGGLIWAYTEALVPLFGPTQKVYKAMMTAMVGPIFWAYKALGATIFGGRSLPMCLQGILSILRFFGVGVWDIFVSRANASLFFCEDINAEADWGFGQLVPMFLLALPFLAALDVSRRHPSANEVPLTHLLPTHSNSNMDVVGSPSTDSFMTANSWLSAKNIESRLDTRLFSSGSRPALRNRTL
ncbi:hypothetical protein C8J57DRAFT_1517174 [Mycena rebaudengoi]|nr:hypothetical protein C8J57DRAFT_1517174 [Mycena rebaudengoi]